MAGAMAGGRPTGFAARIAALQRGETIRFRETGNSMLPHIASRAECTYAPVLAADDVLVGDIVWCHVGRSFFTHFCSAIFERAGSTTYPISSAGGHINGCIGIGAIHGRVTHVNGRALPRSSERRRRDATVPL